MSSLPSDVQSACSYELDSALNLLSVDEQWKVFAVRSGAPELARSTLLRRSVLDAICDSTTTGLYIGLFDRVSRTGISVTIPFRGDSPTVRRFMTLTIAPAATGFCLSSSVVRTETRPLQPLLMSLWTDGLRTIRMCSWCKRVEAGGRWLEIEAAVIDQNLLGSEPLPSLTHGVCEPCRQAVERVITGSWSARLPHVRRGQAG